MVPVCKPGTEKKKSILILCFQSKFCVLGTAKILEETMPCEEVGFW
jgi:hypothetical protein